MKDDFPIYPRTSRAAQSLWIWALLLFAAFVVGLFLGSTADAAVTLTESTVVSLYRGTSKVGDHPSWSACQSAARAAANASTAVTGTVTYSCKTEVRKVVARYTADPPPPPAPVAGTAALSWTAPTRNTDGSALTNLAGFRVHYGRSPTELVRTLEIDSPVPVSAVIADLAAGAWYFCLRAVATGGTTSACSNIVQKTVQ